MCSGRVGPVPLHGPAAHSGQSWLGPGGLARGGAFEAVGEGLVPPGALRGCRGQGWDQRAEQGPEYPCALWRRRPPPCSRPTHIFHYLRYYRTVTVSNSPRWGFFTDSLSTRASSVAGLAGSHVFQIP